MRIVILDGYTINPGDLSWEPLRALGELTVYDDTPESAVPARAKGAQAIIYNRIHMSEELLRRLPDVRYLGTFSTGYNTTDIAAAARRGIPVCNVPSYCEDTVAQFAFSLLLGLCNHVESHSALVHENRWKDGVSMSYFTHPFTELAGKTLGLLGYGSIARRVAVMGKAFGMRVIATRRHGETAGAESVSFEELLRQSDVLSLHCPLTDETRHKIDRAALAKMKHGALLINTARGAVVDEAAVSAALCSGQLGGYAADVFETEPDLHASPLLHAPHTLLTPHIAWSSQPARRRLVQAVADNLAAWQSGKLLHCVNKGLTDCPFIFP